MECHFGRSGFHSADFLPFRNPLETLVPMVLEFPLWLFALEDVQKTVESQVDFGSDEQVADCL